MRNVSRILFATSAEHPQLTDDDRAAVEVLEDLGVQTAPLVWSEAGQQLGAGDTVVLRSCWDYHLHFTAFTDWLRAVEASGALLLNPASAVHWNLDKRYLLELQSQGASVVPTVLVPRGSSATIRAVMEEQAWESIVMKPVISLSAWETRRVHADAVAESEAHFARLVATRDMLVQQYLPEIAVHGEWSLIYFGGKYSHSVLKQPQPGDFRVQVEHGGSVQLLPAPPAVVDTADAVLRALGFPLSYARVDGVCVNGEFLLMELECIDPVLHLRAQPGAAERFARQIMADARAGAPSTAVLSA